MTIEETRLVLCGFGDHNHVTTKEEWSLRCIVFANPVIRKFDRQWLRDRQERFLDLRLKFMQSQDEDELRRIAKLLIKLDDELSVKQIVGEGEYP